MFHCQLSTINYLRMKNIKLILVSSPLRDELGTVLGESPNKLYYLYDQVLFIQGYKITSGVDNIETYRQDINDLFEALKTDCQLEDCRYFLFHYADIETDTLKGSEFFKKIPNAKIVKYSSDGETAMIYEEIKKLYKEIVENNSDEISKILQNLLNVLQGNEAFTFLHNCLLGNHQDNSVEELKDFTNYDIIKQLYQQLLEKQNTTDYLIALEKLRDAVLNFNFDGCQE